MKHKRLLHITGITEDNVLVLKGCFRLLDTHGIPAPLIVSILADQGYMVDWVNFCEDAMRHGWKLDTAIVKLREAVGDTYDRSWVLGWEEKMRRYKQLREEMQNDQKSTNT